MHTPTVKQTDQHQDMNNGEHHGLQRKLKARHLTMISLGGCIGTGLFLASGGASESKSGGKASGATAEAAGQGFRAGERLPEYPERATTKGSYDVLASTIHQIKMGTGKPVPTFIPNWRARRDSNS